MNITRPSFFDSPYFVAEDENWHLKDGAPDDVVEEFKKFMKAEEDAEKRGIDT